MSTRVAVSLSCGISAGVVLTHALKNVVSQLVEGGSQSPIILVGVSLLLALVAAFACAVPARRAALVDPVLALRD